jgi:predicted transcriptional regulator of viral defense system
LIDDDHGTWIAATLASPKSYLNRLSAACAWGVLDRRPPYETVVRPGSGGPRVFDGIVVYRSTTLVGETTEIAGIPITTMTRTLLDLACFASNKALARAIREAIRLERTTMRELGDYLGRCQHRRGCLRLARALARYRGLPIERARSGAEIRAPGAVA